MDNDEKSRIRIISEAEHEGYKNGLAIIPTFLAILFTGLAYKFVDSTLLITIAGFVGFSIPLLDTDIRKSTLRVLAGMAIKLIAIGIIIFIIWLFLS